MTAPDDGGLFPGPTPLPAVVDDRTDGQRQRDRQLAAIRAGMHPLSLVPGVGPIALHPDARRDGDRDDRSVPRCGGCQHRRTINGGCARSFPKCLAGAVPHIRTIDGRRHSWETHPRRTNGGGSDIPAWFPACVDYTPRGEVTR